MKKILLLLLSLFALGLQAQKISNEEPFPVNGYMLSTVGYPSKVLPGDKEQFVYIEYWQQGEGRRTANYYIQSYDSKLEEVWATPVTKEGAPKIDILDLYRLNTSIAVVGLQYNTATKMKEVKVQMFGIDGKEKAGLLKMSIYDKKSKSGFENEFAVSPDKSQFLWMGHNPAASYKKRREFVTVYGSNSQMTWSKELFIPNIVDKKYKVKQVEVDNKGNAYFLLKYEAVTNTAKDTVNLPIILRYDFREKKFTEHKLEFPGASVPEIQMHLTQKGELVIVGIISDGSASGFMNGEKAFGTALRWNKIVYKQFNIERELTLNKEAVLDVPENWVTKYAANGSNFSQAEVYESNNRLYWVLEEFFVQQHNNQPQYCFYDIASVAIDIPSGKILWANNFEKKQRDYNNGRLFSYTGGVTTGKLNLVYLTEKGAQGKLRASSFNLETGAVEHKDLALNETATYMFFPKRSGMISDKKMILMGVGEPTSNEYKLIEITF